MPDYLVNPDSVTRILLVEDNPGDIRLMLLAFEKDGEWRTCVTVAEDGEEAMEYLTEDPNREERTDLVILDLNLPKRDGAEVFRWIRQTKAIHNVPVAILSSLPREVIDRRLGTADLGACCYLAKPADVECFRDLTKTLHNAFKELWIVPQSSTSPPRIIT